MSHSPLPTIDDSDLLLEVHTHQNLRMASQPPNDKWGDIDRLAELGKRVLNTVVTYHFFAIRPFMHPEEIRMQTERYTGAAQLDQWLDSYQLKNKLRVPPSESQEILSDLDQMARYFHTYVGALYITKGVHVIQTWISRLIDPEGHINLPNSPTMRQDGLATQNYSAGPSTSSYPSPPPPASAPPPVPASNPVNLALVNQTAIQKGLTINYIATSEGPPHQPTWTVKCTVNGNERGIGIAKSQKLAKEEAARRAWVAMGW